MPLLCTAFLCAVDAKAQRSRWELAGGANWTRYRDPLGTEHGPRTGRRAEGMGFSLGATRAWQRSGTWGEVLMVQAAWSSAGYSFDESGGGYGTKFLADGLDRGRRSMQVLSADVLAALAWHGLPGLRLEAGPMVRVVLGAWDRRRGERLLQNGPRPLDERTWSRDLLAPVDAGLCLGALVEGPEGIGFMLRSFTGLTDLDRAPGASASYTAQLQFLVVYRW